MLNTNKFTIGVCTVVLLAVLRLALGWHFLYEGVWKIRHPDLFVGETEGFLSGARGPMSGLFNGMVPDIDGHQRLEANLTEVAGKDAPNKKVLKLAESWDKLRQEFVKAYYPANGDDDAKKLHQQFCDECQRVYDRHVQGLKEFVKENGEKIRAHFESLKRYEEGLKADPRTMFQRQRRWDEMQDLRKEAKGWTSDLDSRENALKAELLGLLRKERVSEVKAVLDAEKEAAAKEKAEAKKPAASAPERAASFNPEPAATAAASKPAKVSPKPVMAKPAAEKPNTAKPKAVGEEKPSDPPRDRSLEPAKAKAAGRAKETVESGPEEAGEKTEGKAAGKDKKTETPSPQPSPGGRGGPVASPGSKAGSVASPLPSPGNKAGTVASPLPSPGNKAGSVASPLPSPGVKGKPVASPLPSPGVKGKPVASPLPSPGVKGEPVAADTAVLINFSPLAKDHPPDGPFAPSKNPLAWKPIEQLACLLTWSLFGIGLCLMLGLFTRPAALAGAGFMLFVVMSQPSYPGVYPLDPPQMGHALLVNKDFVEMMALLVIASTSLGRWTGLDFFIHNFLVKPFCCRCCCCSTSEEKKQEQSPDAPSHVSTMKGPEA